MNNDTVLHLLRLMHDRSITYERARAFFHILHTLLLLYIIYLLWR